MTIRVIGQPKNWVETPYSVEEMRLNPHTYSLYSRLWAFTQGVGAVEMSTRELAKHCRISVSKVFSATKDLISFALIRVVAGDNSHADWIEMVDIRAENEAYPKSGKKASHTIKRYVERPGFVCVFSSVGTPWYKIGSSIHPLARTKEVDAGCDFRCELIHSFVVDDKCGIEKAVHDFFSGKRVAGDWFVLNDDDVSLLRDLNYQTADELATFLSVGWGQL